MSTTYVRPVPSLEPPLDEQIADYQAHYAGLGTVRETTELCDTGADARAFAVSLAAALAVVPDGVEVLIEAGGAYGYAERIWLEWERPETRAERDHRVERHVEQMLAQYAARESDTVIVVTTE